MYNKSPPMKNLIFFFSFVSIFLLLSSSKTVSSISLTLQEAIDQRLINATPMSLGSHSESSVSLNIKNVHNKTIELRVPAGTLYHPQNEDEQTLLQIQDEILVLKPNTTNEIVLDAYCTESYDGSPTEGSSMHIATTKDQKLLGLINHLNGKDIASTEVQDAVWAITDNRDLAYIERTNNDTRALRQYVAQETGREDSWYDAPQNVTVDEDGRFNFETVAIDGQIKFTCKVGDAIHEEIVGPDGEIMFKGGKIFNARGTIVNYKFSIKVTGWPKGEYYVRLHDGTNTYDKFKFNV